MFGGITHRPAVELAARLLDLAPAGLEQVFFCDSGSVAVEVAIKMAFQYWRSRGEKRRDTLLTVRGGYHGDTFAAMSVCDPVTGMHGLFRGLLREQLFAPRPGPAFGAAWNERSIAGFERLLTAQQRAHRRRDPGADRPGGGGDVAVLAALSPARAASSATARGCC